MKIITPSGLAALPIIALSSGALAHEPLPTTDAISINPTECVIYLDGPGAIHGTDGRVFVKFDVKNAPLTVQANCTVTAFAEQVQDISLTEEGFDCFVQINKAGHWHQFLYGTDLEVKTRKRVRNGKATLSCSGPYDPNQESVYNP